MCTQNLFNFIWNELNISEFGLGLTKYALKTRLIRWVLECNNYIELNLFYIPSHTNNTVRKFYNVT